MKSMDKLYSEKNHLLYNPIIGKVQNRQICRDRKISGCQGPGWEWGLIFVMRFLL